MSKEKPKKKVLTPEEKEAKMQAARVYTDGLVEKALKIGRAHVWTPVT